MNYYNRHIGDIWKDTSHLTLHERGVYDALLDIYYAREKPIPDDQAERLIRATTDEDKRLTRAILQEFFKLTKRGWTQKRCEEELKKLNVKVDASRSNGRKGGRPAKTQSKPSDNPVGFQKTKSGNLSQEPIASNQEPVTNTPQSPAGEIVFVPGVLDTPAFREAWDRWHQHRREIKKPLKPTQIAAQLKMLAKIGPLRAIAMINYTISMGWQGLREADGKAEVGPKKLTDPDSVGKALKAANVSSVQIAEEFYAQRFPEGSK
jgi:uncharacterized protein YdaU (DUF1376 family)